MIDKNRKKQFVAEFSCFLTDLCNDYYMNGHDDGYADGLKDKNMDLPVSWDDAYRRGLEDAWKTALQIANMTMDECKEIFGDCSYFALVAYNYTADQAMKKIMDYEERQTDPYQSDMDEAWEQTKQTEEKYTPPMPKEKWRIVKKPGWIMIPKCPTCKYFNSSLMPCNNCKDNSEYEPAEERQTEKSCENCFFYGHCKYYGKTLTWLLGDKNEQTGDKVCKSWKPNGAQMRKESHDTNKRAHHGDYE